MEIKSRPLNKEKADKLRKWLHQSELILLIEQLEYRAILAEQAVAKRMLKCDEYPFAIEDARKKVSEAHRYRFMIDQLNELAGVSDNPSQHIESELITLDIELIDHIIEPRIKHASSS